MKKIIFKDHEKLPDGKSITDAISEIKSLVGAETDKRMSRNFRESKRGVLYLTEDDKLSEEIPQFETISTNDLTSLKKLIKITVNEEFKRRNL